MPCPAGPDLGAQIEEPITRDVVVPWVRAELWSERRTDVDGEQYTAWWTTVTLDCPPEGEWMVAWMTRDEPEPVVGYVPLNVA